MVKEAPKASAVDVHTKHSISRLSIMILRLALGFCSTFFRLSCKRRTETRPRRNENPAARRSHDIVLLWVLSASLRSALTLGVDNVLDRAVLTLKEIRLITWSAERPRKGTQAKSGAIPEDVKSV